MSIPFTRYMLPNGRRVQTEIDMPAETEKKARYLIEQGCYFDIEMLQTGMISMTCDRGDDLISIQVCENGPPVVEAVLALIEDSHKIALDGWKGMLVDD